MGNINRVIWKYYGAVSVSLLKNVKCVFLKGEYSTPFMGGKSAVS